MNNPTTTSIAVRFLQLPATTRAQVIQDLGLTRPDDPDITETARWNIQMLRRVNSAGMHDRLMSHPAMFGPIHWTGDAPTSLHGNGAASFDRTTRNRNEVTCPLCKDLLTKQDAEASEGGDTPHDREHARLSCNMNAETAALMQRRHDTEGMSYTEQVRRGVVIYDYLDAQIKAGAIIHVTYPDGRTDQIHLL